MSGKRWRLIQLFAVSAAVLALLVSAFGASPTVASNLQQAAKPAAKSGRPAQAEVDARLGGKTGPVSIILEMEQPAAAVVYAQSNPSGSKNSPSAAAIGRNQVTKNEQQQQSVLRSINAAGVNATIIYRVQRAYNGIAMRVDAAALAKLSAIEGVKAIHALTPKTIDLSTSVPLIGAPVSWTDYGFLGEGISIGVIDTGIDYIHTDFGGDGDYTGCDFTVTGEAGCFPTAKVVGGYDFAGDDYDADPNSATYNPIPSPDDNPMDCNGHGSHVSGIASGLGVNADGTTYTGEYSTETPFDELKIGPGVAPAASLYGLRVFGCEGSTDLTTQAIDWAIDPNGDGDFSDHLDVINMSLGSNFGSPYDDSAIASDNAAAAGVIVATSSGNSGDVHFVTGAPGLAERAISTASSVDSSSVVDGFLVNAPESIAGVYPASESVAYDWEGNDPVTGDVYYPATNQYGCAPWTDATDLANIAGHVVLVDWRKVGDVNFPCGSVARGNNAVAAGAIGIIMVDNTTTFESAITGSAVIPAVYTVKPVGDALKSELTAGVPSDVSVTFSHEYAASVKVLNPEVIDTLSSFSSRGPSRGGALKPDISAPGQTVFSVAALSGNEGTSLNGTSMASPHMAGVVALLKEAHPTWTVEQIKALAMNGAVDDLFTGQNQTGLKYSPQRVGAGRVDVPAALANDVVAYNADGSGTVSVSYGFVEVVDEVVSDQTVRVWNSGATEASYNVSYDERSAVPGVTYTFPGGDTVTVPAGGSTTFVVRMTAVAADMLNTHDPTLTTTQVGLPRHTLSEASGLILLTPAAVAPEGVVLDAMRVPVYANVRAASDMYSESNALVVNGPAIDSSIVLTGTGVEQSGEDATSVDTVSLVTALELQGISPAIAPITNPVTKNADIQYVGVGSDYSAAGAVEDSEIFFGLTSYGGWDRPASEVEFDVYIDTDMDGVDDYVLYNTSVANAADPTDVFVSALVDLNAGTSSLQDFINYYTAQVPTAVFNNNVMVMGVYASELGLGETSKFSYTVVSFSRESNFTVDVAGPYTYNVAAPGLDFAGGFTGIPTYPDLPGVELPVTYNQANFQQNASLGALLLHHFNTAGNRTEVLGVQVVGNETSTPTATATATSTATATATGTAIATATTVPTEPFTDVNPGDYFYQSVNWLYGHGAVSGYSDLTYRPFGASTRAQLIKIIVIAEGYPLIAPATASFSDVPTSHPFFNVIETAVARGLISGYGDHTFKPDNQVTRGQIAKIVVGAQGWAISNPQTPTFVDVPTSDPFFGVIETAYDHYAISGYSCSDVEPCPGLYFRPGAPATRGQIAKIIYLSITTPEQN